MRILRAMPIRLRPFRPPGVRTRPVIMEREIMEMGERTMAMETEITAMGVVTMAMGMVVVRPYHI